eukprot:5258548-Alexandrium_andersonii.AAC.2
MTKTIVHEKTPGQLREFIHVDIRKDSLLSESVSEEVAPRVRLGVRSSSRRSMVEEDFVVLPSRSRESLHRSLGPLRLSLIHISEPTRLALI